jgi:hypothetical protein
MKDKQTTYVIVDMDKKKILPERFTKVWNARDKADAMDVKEGRERYKALSLAQAKIVCDN